MKNKRDNDVNLKSDINLGFFFCLPPQFILNGFFQNFVDRSAAF